MNAILSKIIQSGIGKSRKISAMIGLGLAVLFILIAVQIHANFNELLYGKASKTDSADFLVINKIVSNRTTDKTATFFTADDIAELQQQPFVLKLGTLTAANFGSSVSSFSNALPFSSDLFFESVPDEFLDVKSDEWKWEEGQLDLPIIIPSFFLDLYNSGMALSMEHMPQLSAETIMNIPLRITINGKGKVEDWAGHVVAQSDRINSILVPESFMKFANEKYGYQKQTNPARVVIKVKDPSDPKLTDYLDTKGWKTNTEKTRFSHIRKIVNGVVGVTGGIGMVLLFFGLLVFSLFMQLTITSCKDDITLLQTIGVSPKHLKGFLLKQFLPGQIILLIVALITVSILQVILKQILSKYDMVVSNFVSINAIVACVIIGIVLWYVNKKTIEKYITTK